MSHFRPLRFVGACVLAMACAPVFADSSAAITAFQKKDYSTAFPLMQTAANGGDATAMYDLAMMYWNGLGVEPTPDKALTWLQKGADAGNADAMNVLANMYMTGGLVPQDPVRARELAEKSANLGNAGGEVMYYFIAFNGPELGYRVNGETDVPKYQALAKRTIAERTLDQKAYAMLGKALDQKNSAAMVYAASEMINRAGPGNRQHALSLMQQLSELPEQLQRFKPISEGIASLGESYGNIDDFMTAREVAKQQAAALGEKSGALKSGGCSADDLKVSKISISRPLADPVYLPATQELLKNVFLISGSWQETWTFDACGQSIPVPIEFHADGMGGAAFKVVTGDSSKK